MTSQEARAILSLYQPGRADANDPEYLEALARMRQDPELQAWFEDHCAVQAALRARFRQIGVPEGLREQILSERRSWLFHKRLRRSAALVVVAAAIAVLVSVAALWFGSTTPPSEELNFDLYRNRMVSAVLREYRMTLETNSPTAIRAYLARNQSPADYVLPKGLANVANTGCGLLNWQSKPVSMICFLTGRPLRPGEKADLFLFVVDRDAVPDAPSGSATQITEVNSLMTATWTEGRKVYVLATEGDAELIRQYLN